MDPTRSKRPRRLAIVLAGLILGLPFAAAAQNVAYVGTLRIGFGDASHQWGVPNNYVIPHCAGAGPLANRVRSGRWRARCVSRHWGRRGVSAQGRR